MHTICVSCRFSSCVLGTFNQEIVAQSVLVLLFCSIITSRKFVFYGPFAVPFLSHSSNTFLNSFSFSFSSMEEGGTMIVKGPPGQHHTNHENTSPPRKTDNIHNYDFFPFASNIAVTRVYQIRQSYFSMLIHSNLDNINQFTPKL